MAYAQRALSLMSLPMGLWGPFPFRSPHAIRCPHRCGAVSQYKMCLVQLQKSPLSSSVSAL